MKKSFLGYNAKEVDETISKLNEHNELLTKRLARQEEEIKELRARYAGYSTVEAKLNSAVDVMSKNVANLDNSVDTVESFGDAQNAYGSISALSSDLVATALNSQAVIKDRKTALDNAKSAMDNSLAKSRELQEKLLDIAATGRAIYCLMESSREDDREVGMTKLLPYMHKIQTDSFEAVKLDIPFNIEQASRYLSDVDMSEVIRSSEEVSEHALQLKASSESAGATLDERNLALRGIREEITDLQRSIATLTAITSYVGKLSNEGLADIEQNKVEKLLDKKNEAKVRVDISDPSDLVDNTKPPVIPEEKPTSAPRPNETEKETQAATELKDKEPEDQQSPSFEPDGER